MRQFALTLHYYSPPSYDFVQETFICCLPCTSTIRSWYCSINGEPGFSNEALLAIQNLHLATPYPIVGCILVYGMSLRKQLQSNGNKTFEYVDFGGVIKGIHDDSNILDILSILCIFQYIQYIG